MLEIETESIDEDFNLSINAVAYALFIGGFSSLFCEDLLREIRLTMFFVGLVAMSIAGKTEKQ